MVGEAIESRVGVSGGWELRGFKVQGFRLWALCVSSWRTRFVVSQDRRF